jgi:GTP cyclohydrolase I
MSGIEVAVRLPQPDGGSALVPARAAAWVSLDDPAAKGIHMSRLYLALTEGLAAEPLAISGVRRILEAFLVSHRELSRRAGLSVAFELLMRRPALVSNHSAWRTYPVTLTATMQDGALRIQLGVDVGYSSTCPCSAALARQLVQERFLADFAGQEALEPTQVAAWLGRARSIVATPHAQRSQARVDVVLASADQDVWFPEVIDRIEDVLQTPVQAAVKRADEQEFARRNGHNLMFCEDAGRRLARLLDGDARFADWRFSAVHVESLHPHDAVASAVKGVPGGLTL